MVKGFAFFRIYTILSISVVMQVVDSQGCLSPLHVLASVRPSTLDIVSSSSETKKPYFFYHVAGSRPY